MFRVIYLGNVAKVCESLFSMPNIELAGCFVESEDDSTDLELACKQMGIPLFQVSSNRYIQNSMETLSNIDLGIITNFGIILSEKTLSLTRRGFINAHLGLLPENPGRHPIKASLLNSDEITGVTLHWAEKLADSGTIIDQRIISIGLTSDPNEIFERLVAWIPDLLGKNLPNILEFQAHEAARAPSAQGHDQ